MKKLINKLKIPILAGAFVLFSSSDPNKNKAEDIKVLPGSGKEYHLSRAEAEKGIYRLAKTAYAEDAWIYHNGVLTDVGYEISKDKVRLDLNRILNKYENIKDTLYLYHNHIFKAWGDKVSPPSGIDFIFDKFLKHFIDVKKDQVNSKVYDFSGEWSYISNPFMEKLDSVEKPKIRRSIHYVHCEAFPGRERTEEDIEFFIKRMKEDGFEVKYKKLE